MRSGTYILLVVVISMVVTVVSSAPMMEGAKFALRSRKSSSSSSSASVKLGEDEIESNLWDVDKLSFKFVAVQLRARTLLWKTAGESKSIFSVLKFLKNVEFQLYKWEKVRRQKKEEWSVDRKKYQLRVQQRVEAWREELGKLENNVAELKPILLSDEELDNVTVVFETLERESKVLMESNKDKGQEAAIKNFSEKAAETLKLWWEDPTVKERQSLVLEDVDVLDQEEQEQFLVDYKSKEKRYIAKDKASKNKATELRAELDRLQGKGVTGPEDNGDTGGNQ